MSSAILPLQGELQEVSSQPVESVRRYYRPELDVLRFAAFFLVFVHHGIYTAFPLLSICGGFGLCLFFFLSAFLITELLTRERTLTGTVNVRSFYVRRVLRIWPLYLAAILAAALASVFSISHHVSAWFFFSYLLMLGNLYIARCGFPNTFIAYLWSISIEEQFYLLWPWLNRTASERVRLFVLMALAPLGAAAVVVLGYLQAAPAQGIWTNSIVQFQFFSFGAVTALLLKNRLPRISVLMRLGLILLGGSLWSVAAWFSGIDDRIAGRIWAPMFGYWAVAFGCVCFLFALLGCSDRYLPRSLIELGKISYGLYVFHQGALEVAAYLANRIPRSDSASHHTEYGIMHLLIGLAITVTVSFLSYRYFERPFLRFKEKFEIVHSRPS